MIKYSAPYARMRGLKGKLLGKSQLEDFLGAPDTQAIISALGRTVYGEYLRDPVDLPGIEHGLKQDLVVSYLKILIFLSGKSGRFLEALLGKFELLNLKSIIRWIARGPRNTKDSVEPFIFSLGRYHSIPVKEALEAEDLESCIALMENTPFARPLEIGYQQYVEAGTQPDSVRRFFFLELALDLDYYERLWRALDALGPLDKHNAGRLLGIQYDINNLVWILRFKQYYNFSPEQIFQYIIPHGWKIHGDIFWEVAADGDVTGAIVARQVSPYDDLLRATTQVNHDVHPYILGIELRLLRYLHRKSLETFMKFPLQAALLLAFFMLKEMEIRDIITILSGKNLGVPQERIRSYMVTL